MFKQLALLQPYTFLATKTMLKAYDKTSSWLVCLALPFYVVTKLLRHTHSVAGKWQSCV